MMGFASVRAGFAAFALGSVILVAPSVAVEAVNGQTGVAAETVGTRLAQVLENGNSSIVTLQPPRRNDYHLTATLAAGITTITGFVPDDAIRKRLAALPGVNVSGLSLARGEPSAFADGLDFGLAVLARLDEGRFEFRDGTIFLEGRARTAQDFAAIGQLAAPRGVDLAMGGVRPPLADPFIWTAEKSAEGGIRFTGFVPGESTRARLTEAAVAVTSDAAATADGAPEGFEASAIAGLSVLGKLPSGTVRYDGDNWAIAANAATPLEAAQAQTAFRAAGLDAAGWVYSVALPSPQPVEQPPQVADYTWSAEKLPAGTIALDGYVPTDGLRRVLARRAGQQSVDEQALGAGAPDTFPLDALAAIDALALLDEGKVALVEGQWSLTGVSADPGVPAALAEVLGPRSAAWTVQVTTPPIAEVAAIDPDASLDPVEAPVAEQESENATQDASSAEPSTVPESPNVPAAPVEPTPGLTEAAEPAATAPSTEVAAVEPSAVAPSASAPVSIPARVVFDATRTAGSPIVMTGEVSAEPARAYFGVIAGMVSTDGISISGDLPSDFIPNAEAGLRVLTTLYDGRLAFDGTHWYLTGTASTETERAAIAEQALITLPPSGQWVTGFGVTPPLELCRVTVASFVTGKPILFQSGSTRMTDESRASLGELATDLQSCPETAVYVEGHTDADGPDDLNLALSVARAEAVVDALVELGVGYQRLYAVGYGESLPIADNETAAGKRANRRIVVSIMDQEQ